MARRWVIMLAMLALTFGTAFATTTSEASAATSNFNPGGLMHHVGSSGVTPAVGGVKRATSTSTNWSGYAATTGTYTSVSASWTEPTGTCTSGAKYSSFWVGLDGYNSSTVEQTGSEVDCSGRTAEYYGWYEAYPAASHSYSNTVRPGDHFNASVTYSGSNRFALVLADTTQGWSHTTNVTVSGAARSSAEVIVEAPCCTASGGILPLADFGKISITNSLANGAALGSAGGVTGITMINNSGQDKDTITSLTGGESFSATWVRAN